MSNGAEPPGGIRVQPVGGALGALVSGVDLREPLTDADFAQIHRALLAHQVLVFRSQDLNDAQQMALARRFGEPSLFPLQRMFGVKEPSTQTIEDGPDSPPETDEWHTDVTWIAEPPKIGILSAQLVPEVGGDTMWASMTAAYDALSPVMRHMLDGLQVRHSCWPYFCEVAERKSGIAGLAQKVREAYPAVVQPLVRTHPETGRRALFLGGGFMREIVGATPEESRTILDFLARHIDQPRLHFRWRWEPTDLAIWDERCTCHRGVSDHFPRRRAVRRCTVDGGRPFFDPDRQPDPAFAQARGG